MEETPPLLLLLVQILEVMTTSLHIYHLELTSKFPDVKAEEKLNASVSMASETPKPGAANEVVTQINEFIATVALPNMRRILVDNDKVSSACANIVYYVVSPSLKGKAKPMEVESVIVTMIYELSKIPSAFKTWRSPVTELLNDNRLFNGAPDAAEGWKPIIRTIFDTDKTAFPELLSMLLTLPTNMLIHSILQVKYQLPLRLIFSQIVNTRCYFGL